MYLLWPELHSGLCRIRMLCSSEAAKGTGVPCREFVTPFDYASGNPIRSKALLRFANHRAIPS